MKRERRPRWKSFHPLLRRAAKIYPLLLCIAKVNGRFCPAQQKITCLSAPAVTPPNTSPKPEIHVPQSNRPYAKSPTQNESDDTQAQFEQIYQKSERFAKIFVDIYQKLAQKHWQSESAMLK